MDEATPETDAVLATALEVLGSPVRLAILRQLRRPTGVTRIQVTSDGHVPTAGKHRPLSRQAVSRHLEVLREAGLVHRLPKKGRVRQYVIDHQRLFAVVDEMRRVARLRPVDFEGPATATISGRSRTSPRDVRGPRLVLVYGRDDGAVFPLGGPVGSMWTLGREPEMDVALDYDPYISSLHGRITREDEGLVLTDAESSNGTFVDGLRLAPGDGHVLEAGDIVTVGRSRLVFKS